MQNDSQGVFEIMRTMRPMRRLKPDPVPDALLERVLDAGTWAPNSLNSQPYRFLVIRDPDSKRFFAERYDRAIKEGFAGLELDPADASPPPPNNRTPNTNPPRNPHEPLHHVICGTRKTRHLALGTSAPL